MKEQYPLLILVFYGIIRKLENHIYLSNYVNYLYFIHYTQNTLEHILGDTTMPWPCVAMLQFKEHRQITEFKELFTECLDRYESL